VNVVVVSGKVSRAPEVRRLPSGDELVGLEVTVPASEPGGRAESVPVTWFDAPAWATGMVKGNEVVVIGRVRRRFFRTPGGTQSRTEVVAETVVKAGQAGRVASVLARARDRLAS
jgi:single-strand DNA-binding protein